MASNSLCSSPEVVVIDQSLKDRKDIFQTKNPSQVILHTGNIANWNSLRSRKTQLPVNELFQSLKTTLENWVQGEEKQEEDGYSCASETLEKEDERALLKISVKVMLQNEGDTTCIEKALDSVLDKLKVNYLDSVILAIPPCKEGDTTPFEETMQPYWKEMERFHEKGIARNISSCDLDQKLLEKLVNIAKIKPEVNQVNLMSCCHMPEELVEYAKAVDIVLHTHGDQPEMLPEDSVNDLIHSIEPSSQLNWKCDWIVRYTVIIKCRGIIKCKGYIASIHTK